MPRPISVTVICWILISHSLETLAGLLSGFGEALLRGMSNTMEIHQSFSTTISFVEALLVIKLVLAAFMLFGDNWARITYICIAAVTILGFIILPSHVPLAFSVSDIVKFVVFGYILFQPQANQFFSGKLDTGQAEALEE